MVTLKDVAQRAGVTAASVSLVLSGKSAGRVSPERAHAIRKAARELNYVPNHAARSIARTDLYAGQVVDTDEGWVFTGFNDPPGAFAGTMPDPFALADVVAPRP